MKASNYKDQMDMIEELLGISSYKELNDLHYIIINSNRLKLPAAGRFQGVTDIPTGLVLKFLTNPMRITNEDDLFDLLYGNKN